MEEIFYYVRVVYLLMFYIQRFANVIEFLKFVFVLTYHHKRSNGHLTYAVKDTSILSCDNPAAVCRNSVHDKYYKLCFISVL
jgi:hypothetical protein